MPKKSAGPHDDRVRLLALAVAARRRTLKLTQVELARLAGVGPDFLYDLESGKATVRLDKLLDVLAVLGLELRLGDGKRALAVDVGAGLGPDTTPS